MELVKLLGSSLGPLFGPVLPYLKPHLYQLLPYEIRVGELAKDVNELRKERNRVQHKVNEEENGNERAIDDDVIKWLQVVDGIIFEYDDFCEDEDLPCAQFSNGYLPKPGIRFRLSRIVNDIARRVNAQLQSTKNDEFSYWLGPPSFGADFDNIRYESFASRKQTVHDIMEALKDSNVGMIGVYGRSGVGKTSLIKQVAKEVKGDMFDVVITVNVTSHPDIRRIQEQIADKLGMILEEKSESGRAAHLRERLKEPKEKTLIILDNMGVKLDFNMLGIPSQNNDISQINPNYAMKNPSAHHSYAMQSEEFDASSSMKIEEPLARYKGCKVLMISYSEQLLLSQMDGKGIQTFCVKALTEKEAETMFKTVAEIDNENSLFKTLAAQIANKCKGLPMTLVTTAKALKNKSLPVWEDAYRKIQRQNLTAMQEFSTKLSFEHLENEELKHTFLICARMGQDALITDLVRYCIGLGLLQEIYTVREARDRVHSLVGKLKGLSLLSESFSRDHFTMQDITRDAALSIATQKMHAFAVTNGKLDEWPDMDKLRRYTAISLHHCDMTDIMKEFPESIKCFRLKVFHLDNKDSRLRIRDSFFNGMKELRVLKLIGIHLSPLPSSIKCLTKLRMLCLERCTLGDGKHLSIIEKLKKLRILSLAGSDIERLPVELKQLAKLQIFDISNCFKLQVIPAALLSSLTSLEELYVGRSPNIQWKNGGLGNQSENASLSELRQLNQLTKLEIQIPNDTYFPMNLFFDKLDSYKIIIRDSNAYPVWDFKMPETSEASRYLAFEPENGFDIHNRKEIKLLFKRVEHLLLGQLNDVKDIFNELNHEGFPYLKYLSIVSNSKVKSIINSENPEHQEKAFPKLESLFLYEVNNMEHICRTQLTDDSFGKLKIIKLKICGQLRNVFFSSMIKCLSALETIEVSECNSLKEIVTLEGNSIGYEITFPKLRSLSLQSLSEFIGFYTNDGSTGEQVQNRKPNELFDEKVVISKLERIELSSIRIQKIWNHHALTRSYFQNLIHLDVNDCWNLQYLLSLSMSKSLMNLQSLFVSECGMMESIFIEIRTVKVSNISLVTSKKDIENFLSASGDIRYIEMQRESDCTQVASVTFKDTQGADIAVLLTGSKVGDLNVTITPEEKYHLPPEALPSSPTNQSADAVKKEVKKAEDVMSTMLSKGFILGKDAINKAKAFDKKVREMDKKYQLPQMTKFAIVAAEQKPESIFPKLKNINLGSMKRLKAIWHPKFPLHSFGKLDALIIEGCNKLENVFPSYMVGRFRSLCNLKVTNCMSMKEIFDLKGREKRDAGDMTSLQNVHVEALPKLEYVWNKDPEGILNLKNLEKVWVRECLNLKHIFPVSIAMGLKKLEYLEVWNCSQLKEIVFSEETKNKSGVLFEFPKLTTARFSKLPNLESFYGATHELCCSTLNNLCVEHCHKLKLFRTEIANPETKPVFLPEKVIYNMKSLQIEPCDVNSLKRYMGNYRMHKLKEFQLSKLVDTEILYFFLYRNPNLKSLLLSNSFFEQLVPPRSLVNENSGVVPKLKSLKLMNLPSLKMIGFLEDTVLFRRLECLILKECPCLNTIAPSSVSFNYLTNLEVSNCNKLSCLLTPPTAKSLVQLTTMKVIQCESMKTIVSEQENKEWIIFRQLKEIELDTLHDLESFCSSKHCAFEFPLLETFVVSACGKMELFAFFEDVNKTPILREVCVRHGKEDKRFYWRGDLNATINHLYKIRALDPDNMAASNPLEALESFRLKTLKLVNCKLEEHDIPPAVFRSLKYLEELEVRSTNVEVIFGIKETEMKGYPFPLKKLTLDKLPNLIQVWDKDGEGIRSFQNLQEVIVTNCHNLKTLFLTEMAKRVEKLQKLEIRQCGNFQKIVEEENAISEEFSFPRLTSLDLRMLPQLTCFYPGKAIFILESLKLDWTSTMMLFDGNFAEDMLHELVKLELDFDYYDNEVSNFAVKLVEKASKLEYLQISRCSGLVELFPSQPEHSAVSFSNLKQLSIKECHKLKHLFTSSSARKLVHLEEMYVAQCESMVEIISAQEQDETPSEAIKFERLTVIVLDSLSSLSCFYSGSDTLLLSSLRRVLLLKCPEMRIFSRGDIHAESFVGIQVSLDPKHDLLFHQDLNTTVKMTQRQEFFEALDEKHFSDNLELQANLHGNVGLQNKWLCDLVTLKLDKWILPYAIPSAILPQLKNLENLEVQGSDKVEVIFCMIDTEITGTTSQLKKLTLQGLSNLTRVWEKNSQGVLIFSNLEEVSVGDCENLQTLFPASLAKNLVELEKLEIKCCHKLQAIVEKEEGREANATEKFVFPSLQKLHLDDLPQVTYFYPQTFTLECPALKILSVLDCDELELFQSTSINRQSLISNLKVISNVKELSLDWKHISALSLRFKPEQFAEGLKYLNGISLYFDADENENAMLPIEILQKAPNLVKMSINKCNDPEIFLAQNPNVGEDGMLQSIGSEDSSWLNTICEKLHEINVDLCPHLTTLVDSTSTVSFSCLKQVSISNCPKLQCLFTYSAAKMLMNLEKITVRECASVKEIVAKEGDTTFEAIKFERLNTIVLDSLPSLIWFYSGSDTLQLSSLTAVHIRKCPNMKIFSQGLIYAESFKGIQMSSDPEECLLFHQDLNATVKGMFQRQEFLKRLDKKYFSPNLEPQVILDGNVGLQNKWLCDLVTLKLDKSILPYAIPCGILPHLKNLEELEVRDSDQVEVIFDSEIMETTSKLRILSLIRLSKLRCVWQKNSKGVLMFPNLQVVIVSGCKILQTLFPASLAKNLKKLGKLEIESCDKLVEIVEKEKDTIKFDEITVKECESEKEIVAKGGDATSEAIIFERLKTLDLDFLPSLICFYSGSDTLQFPSLIKVHIRQCPNMKIFSHGVTYAESFQGIQMSFNPKEDLLFYQDLNASIKGMFQRQEFFETTVKKCYPKKLELQADKHGNVAVGLQNRWLRNLVSLKLDKCILPYVIPSAILPHLNNLEELDVRDNDQVEVIFCMNDTEILKTTSQLKKLTLEGLPKLVRVWEKNSGGVLIFGNLQEVVVSDCGNLQTLFPASLARNLKELEKLEIDSCDKLQGIVEKEEGTAANVTKKFVFPRLQNLDLDNLPQVTYFYPQTFTLECPALNNLSVVDCHELELFQSTSVNRLPLISNPKVISNLKKLTLDWKHISALSFKV